jgi:hypothetical protein
MTLYQIGVEVASCEGLGSNPKGWRRNSLQSLLWKASLTTLGSGTEISIGSGLVFWPSICMRGHPWKSVSPKNKMGRTCYDADQCCGVLGKDLSETEDWCFTVMVVHHVFQFFGTCSLTRSLLSSLPSAKDHHRDLLKY